MECIVFQRIFACVTLTYGAIPHLWPLLQGADVLLPSAKRFTIVCSIQGAKLLGTGLCPIPAPVAEARLCITAVDTLGSTCEIIDGYISQDAGTRTRS